MEDEGSLGSSDADNDYDLPSSPATLRALNRRREKEKEAKDRKKYEEEPPEAAKSSNKNATFFRVAVFVVGAVVIAGILYLRESGFQFRGLFADRGGQNEVAPKIPQIERILIEIDASLGVGMNVQQLTSKVQNLATEIEVSKRSGANVKKYEQTRDVFKDAIAFWELNHDRKFWSDGYNNVLTVTADNTYVSAYDAFKKKDDVYKDPDRPHSEKKRALLNIILRNNLVVESGPLDGPIKEYRQAGAVKTLIAKSDCFDQLIAKGKSLLGK